MNTRNALMALAPFTAAWATPAPEGVGLYFIAPKNGATVDSPVRVQFGLRGMGVAPAIIIGTSAAGRRRPRWNFPSGFILCSCFWAIFHTFLTSRR